MRVLLIGATGATGRQTIDHLLDQGHRVTALSRRAEALEARAGLRIATGDVLVPADVDAVMPGHDAVIVVLGIRENPLLVRLRGTRGTAMDVRSRGTANVVAAMRAHGVRRLVVQTTFGAGDSRTDLSVVWKTIFTVLLAPQIRDTEVQEDVVRGSGLDWTLVRPVSLADGPAPGPMMASTSGRTRSMSVGRRDVAGYLAAAVADPSLIGQTVALSAGAPVAGAAKAAVA